MNDTTNDERMTPPVDAMSTEVTIRQRIQAAIDEDGLTQSAAARSIGTSPSILNQWLKGKYSGDNEAVDRKAEQWLAIRARRTEMSDVLPEMPDWFEGPSAHAIKGTLALAHVTGDMVCVYGGPGVGKTETCSRYRSQNANVWMATMAPHCNSVVPALQEIAEAVGVKEMQYTGARPLYRAIVRMVDRTSGLLIIDEAQHLNEKCFDEIRSIHDVTGIGIAIVGNESVFARLTGGNRATQHAQVFSRIGGRKHIAKPDDADVQAQADAWGITDAEIIDFLTRISRKPGALRAVTKTLRLAALQAGSVSEITLDHVKRAWGNLGADR